MTIPVDVVNDQPHPLLAANPALIPVPSEYRVVNTGAVEPVLLDATAPREVIHTSALARHGWLSAMDALPNSNPPVAESLLTISRHCFTLLGRQAPRPPRVSFLALVTQFPWEVIPPTPAHRAESRLSSTSARFFSAVSPRVPTRRTGFQPRLGRHLPTASAQPRRISPLVGLITHGTSVTVSRPCQGG